MFKKINPNPRGNYTDDCVVRALCIALDKPWYEIFIDLCIQGLIMARMPSTNSVWNEYLKKKGWTRHLVPDDCPFCYTLKDFCGEFFKGTYIVGTGTHAICVKNGSYYDTWDSGDEAVLFYWKETE